MANRKQTKKEQKAAKRAAREAARRAERRRALQTAAIVGVVVLVGAALIGFTLVEDRNAAAEQERAAAEAASEAERQASEAASAAAARDVACGAQAPADADAERPTFDEPDDVLTDGTDYRARITTSCGTVVVDLAEDLAPETVNGFVFLAEEGFFDGLEVFRNATTIGALQTGSGSNDASWRIGYTLPDELEFAETDGYPAGSVAMANAGPDTSGSQFFFVYNDQFSLPPTFTRFGTVTEGLDVLEQIGATETIGPANETPGEVVYMERVEILTGPADGASEAPTDEGAPSEAASDQQ